MVKSMNAAWNVPHFGYCDEVVMDGLISMRAELKDIAAKQGSKFSYLPIILKVFGVGCVWGSLYMFSGGHCEGPLPHPYFAAHLWHSLPSLHHWLHACALPSLHPIALVARLSVTESLHLLPACPSLNHCTCCRLQATSLALSSFPMLNATCDTEATQVVYRAAHNIGVAMDTPQGLLVPNVKNVNVCAAVPP
jgi:hypothetical protein